MNYSSGTIYITTIPCLNVDLLSFMHVECMGFYILKVYYCQSTSFSKQFLNEIIADIIHVVPKITSTLTMKFWYMFLFQNYIICTSLLCTITIVHVCEIVLLFLFKIVPMQ